MFQNLQSLLNIEQAPRLDIEPAQPMGIDELCEAINELFASQEGYLLEAGETATDERTRLTMSRVHTVMLSPEDKGFENLRGKVFGIRNEDPIVEFLLEALGVPQDGTPYQIRNGFMKYHAPQKMLFIAKFKSDLPK